MSKETFSIPNISCGHCTMAINNELLELAGVDSVEGDVEKRTVTVKWEAPATRDQIVEKLKEINYPVQ